MIEAVMFFALGFFGATLIALVTLPAVWHRAVRLTTKRIEGAIPLSMTEIQADKDQLRAEFAISTRRLENTVEQLKQKTSEQLAEIGRKTEAARLLKNEAEDKTARVAALELQERTLRTRLNATEEELSARARMLQEAEAALAAREDELARSIHTIAAITSESDGRKAEILALEAQRDALKGRVQTLERELAGAEQRVLAERAASTRAKEALAREQKNTEDAKSRLRETETKLSASRLEVQTLTISIEDVKREAELAAGVASKREDELQARLAERERELAAHLARHESEMLAGAAAREAALKEELRAASGRLVTAFDEIEREQQERLSLRKEMQQQAEAFQATIEILKAEKRALEDAFAQLGGERDRIAGEAAALRALAGEAESEERRESALLRERINDVAAKVAQLAIRLEGANSPIQQILAADAQANGHPSGTPADGEARLSLAQRIRNLQDQAR